MLNISPALIIFDCDGVLVDSEPIANRILAQSLSKEGYECSFEDSIEKFVGRDLTTIVNQVETELGRELSERFFEEVRIAFNSPLLFETKLRKLSMILLK